MVTEVSAENGGDVVRSDRVHGHLLLKFIERVEEEIASSAQRGCRPVLDAVETVRVLRALVEHRDSYESRPIEENRAARWCILTPSAQWSMLAAPGAP